MPTLMLSAQDVADIFGIPICVVNGWGRAGKYCARRVRRRWYFDIHHLPLNPQCLAQYLKDNT